MGDLSAHFDRREFACPHCGMVSVTQDLVQVLESIRSLTGRPLVVLSGYRCTHHNAAVGGALRSQHLSGRAADIKPGRATLAQAQAAGARGVGIKDGYAVHVDTRSTPATWVY